MKYFEDFDLGDATVFPGRYQLTEDNIQAFASEWDPYPFHTDPVAASESFYGGLVASTAHLFAISIKLCHSLPEAHAAISSLGTTDMLNHAPAYAGDTLRTRSTTLEKRLSQSRPGLGIITAQSELVNQDDKVLFSYVNAALYQLKASNNPP